MSAKYNEDDVIHFETDVEQLDELYRSAARSDDGMFATEMEKIRSKLKDIKDMEKTNNPSQDQIISMKKNIHPLIIYLINKIYNHLEPKSFYTSWYAGGRRIKKRTRRHKKKRGKKTRGKKMRKL